ncbi:MAG: BadF/BadG/BcrA/BcrD ATPase family protein [Salibacteraceae bacterium]
MICIADSGSTKTDWALIKKEDQSTNVDLSYSSRGLNPFYNTIEEISSVVVNVIPSEQRSAVSQLFFYGAGCSNNDKKKLVRQTLESVFINAEVTVNHDLLGAARAAAQHEKGIVSILGTGSNSCHYDGNVIIDNIPNLGFILGDEGSGSALGKALVRARCYRDMPKGLARQFDDRFNFDFDQMLNKVYSEPMPNRYMAAFAPFCSEFRNDTFIQSLLLNVFENFVKTHLIKYDSMDLKHHFIGSIAYNFKEELFAVLKNNGLKSGRVIQKPVSSLVQYHKSSNGI